MTQARINVLAQGHKAVTPVRLEPAAHSTTEPLRSSQVLRGVWGGVLIWLKSIDNSVSIFQKTYTVQHDG